MIYDHARLGMPVVAQMLLISPVYQQGTDTLIRVSVVHPHPLEAH